MKRFLIIGWLLSCTQLFAQDTLQLVSKEIVYLKSNNQLTKRPSKAAFKITKQFFYDGYVIKQKENLAENQLLYKRYYQHDVPFGTWQEDHP